METGFLAWRILFYQAEVECQNPGRKNPFISFNLERFRTFWMGFGILATVITLNPEKSALKFLGEIGRHFAWTISTTI